MSGTAITIRQEIIQETVPELIKSLTGFKEDDENFETCEHFIFSKFKNSRWLGVNSHAVKRKIAEIQERLEVESLKPFGDHLAKLCEEVVSHPICKEHYELDIGWAIIDFLITIAGNPISELRKNGDKLLCTELDDQEETEENKELEELKNELKQDFIECKYSDDSELSEWSENDFDNSEDPSPGEPQVTTTTMKIELHKNGLKPPEPECPYKLFDGSKSLQYLLENSQHSWWLEGSSHMALPSDEMEANFAVLYNDYIRKTSYNLIKTEEISTHSEYVLMREIIWFFNFPVKCAFFEIQDNKVKVRPNVTIPSITCEGLNRFLEGNFIPYFVMSKVLNDFQKSIYSSLRGSSIHQPPKTYECYASNLKCLLEPFNDKLIEWESRLKSNKPYEVNTLIAMHQFLKQDLKFLDRIFSIHFETALDFNDHPPHILTTYMLSGMLKSYKTAYCKEDANLAVTLFITTVKVYFHIIDIWWSEGRLDDWINEFLVEKINSEHEEITLRLFKTNEELNFSVPEHISNQIFEDNFIKLLINHSMEASYTLNFLYEIGKISQLTLACNFEQNLYETFMDDLWKNLSKFSGLSNTTSTQTDSTSDDERENPMKRFVKYYSKYEPDEFLIAAFECNSEMQHETTSEKKRELSALEIYERLQSLSEEVPLPLEEIMLQSISNILSTRISVSNEFVVRMFKEDFQLMKHIQNIRKVLFMEASDLMHYFNVKLFSQIESNKPWTNTLTLSRQLEGALTLRYPDMLGKFQVEIMSSYRSRTFKVLEAINEIKISYNTDPELEFIITSACMDTYNEIFRIILKIKWGLYALENMFFPTAQKRRRPYTPLGIPEFIMKRLQQIRFWLIYVLQNINYHFMAYVLERRAVEMDEEMGKCKNLMEMKETHSFFISTIRDECFVTNDYLRNGIEQILTLTMILRDEWILTTDMVNASMLNTDVTDIGTETDIIKLLEHVDNIEKTYVVCHEHLAKGLSDEVYGKQNNELSGLSDAFMNSMPC